MSAFYSSNTNYHYNPNEPRDERGRWTTGGSSWRDNPVRRPEPAGRAHLLLGHALVSAWHQGLIREFKLPTDAEAEQFARTLAVWNAASDFDPEPFREHFTQGLVDKPATVARLRQAAAGAAEAETIGQMVDASRPLTQAIREIGADRWPWVREGLADKAAAAMPVQFAAHVGTTAPTIPTGQPGRAAGHSPQECGPGNAGEGQSYAATNSQSDRKGPPTGLSAGDPPASDSAGSQHPADWDGTVGDCGGNTRLDVIKRQISEALKNKRAIALVGGAADDSTNGPVAQIKKDMEKKYPGVQIQYFTHDQGEELAQWLREQGQVYGSNNVAVIGHSWGGDTAATVVAHGVNVGALVTIDPVSNFPPDLGDVKANARNWININANPDRAKRAAEGSGPGNWIAGLGGAWNDDPKDYADHHYNANINHAGVWELLPP